MSLIARLDKEICNHGAKFHERLAIFVYTLPLFRVATFFKKELFM